MAKEVLTAEEVAAYLNVTPVTVYRWCREGRLPCVKMGRVWRVRRAALDAFLDHDSGPQTLTKYLQSFLDVPDHVIAVAESEELLHRLDAAFFRLGEAHGDVLVIVLRRGTGERGPAARRLHAGRAGRQSPGAGEPLPLL